MNERIKELAKKAGWSGFDILDERNQKFAEYLILECIAVHKDDYGVDIIGKVLKKHFGVSDER